MPLAPVSSTTPTPTQTQPPQPTLNGRDRDGKKKTCLCGSPDHRQAKCPHLFEQNRLLGFKVDSAIQKQINEKRAKSKNVETSIQDIIAKHEKLSKSPLEAEKHVPIGCVVTRLIAIVLPATLLNNVHLALIKSYILDSGVTEHVCNNQSRFINFTPTPSDKLLVTGTSTVYIKGHGTVSITIECERTESTPDGQRTFQLYNVAFILSFTTNVVSYNRFHDKGIFWDLKSQCLVYDNIVIGKTPRRFGQWVLEYNAVDPNIALLAILTRAPLPKATWTIEQAHERTGHTYAEALQHLPEACSDIASVKGEHVSHCQIYRQHNAKKLISRQVPIRAHRPFYRLCQDVIPMRDGYVVHLYDDFLSYHFVERTFSTQAQELVKIIRKCVNTYKRRWNFNIIIIRLDG